MRTEVFVSHPTTIKRIVLTAACLGILGGLLKNLHVLISFLFAPQGSQNSYVITGLVFAEQLLFIAPVCATRGLAERSARLLKVGIVIGVIAGFLTGAMIVLFVYVVGVRENPLFHSWFNYILVSAPLLGVAAGIVNASSDRSTRNVCSFAFIGLIGGGLAVLSYYLTVSLTTLAELFLSRVASTYTAYVFDRLMTPPILGATISVTVWWFMATAEEYF